MQLIWQSDVHILKMQDLVKIDYNHSFKNVYLTWMARKSLKWLLHPFFKFHVYLI